MSSLFTVAVPAWNAHHTGSRQVVGNVYWQRDMQGLLHCRKHRWSQAANLLAGWIEDMVPGGRPRCILAARSQCQPVTRLSSVELRLVVQHTDMGEAPRLEGVRLQTQTECVERQRVPYILVVLDRHPRWQVALGAITLLSTMLLCNLMYCEGVRRPGRN